MEINFQCKKCRQEFDCEMGKIGMNEQTMRPDFENQSYVPAVGRELWMKCC